MRPEDEERARLTRAWLDRARSDLTVAERAAEPPPVLNITVFLCQQAAEKALKALLTWHDQPYRRIHALDDLLLQCAEVDPSITELDSVTRALTPYAVEPRYPSEHGDPTPDEADEARRCAKTVVEAVRQRLPDYVTRNQGLSAT